MKKVYYSTIQQLQTSFNIYNTESTLELFVALFNIYRIPTFRLDYDKREEISPFE